MSGHQSMWTILIATYNTFRGKKKKRIRHHYHKHCHVSDQPDFKATRRSFNGHGGQLEHNAVYLMHTSIKMNAIFEHTQPQMPNVHSCVVGSQRLRCTLEQCMLKEQACKTKGKSSTSLPGNCTEIGLQFYFYFLNTLLY